ncbi:hypothetical protein LPB140_04935 [Sphingorhabdus lutea]|uniref:Ribbon-helix-helix protein CopG domain-containing protein n=1 Tax=Sphingorhabdus lutea TaxID=1913578 RepID=A0A1L3JAU2_9SPHN|nr:ribbon-helix-helix protein, CopG family [Sphingorhabdus lutea]APG62254.1 hypothetical protein LPB140_04935 [Sphingorhabdus lutea]
MRILADLPDDDVNWLDEMAQQQGKSRAQLLRDAVAAFRADMMRDWILDGASYWAGKAPPAETMARDEKPYGDKI